MAKRMILAILTLALFAVPSHATCSNPFSFTLASNTSILLVPPPGCNVKLTALSADLVQVASTLSVFQVYLSPSTSCTPTAQHAMYLAVSASQIHDHVAADWAQPWTDYTNSGAGACVTFARMSTSSSALLFMNVQGSYF